MAAESQEKQTQSNPISEKLKMNVNLYIIEDYRKKMISQPKKTNPNKPSPERSRMGQFQIAELAGKEQPIEN